MQDSNCNFGAVVSFLDVHSLSRLRSVAIVLEKVIYFDNALLNDEEFNARKV
jgi:hypothetical protein